MTGRWAGTVSSSGPSGPGEHLPVGQLGQPLVDRLVQSQPALVDEDQRGDSGHGLRHRRDAEDGVLGDRRATAGFERAGHAAADLTPSGDEPRQTDDAAAVDVAADDLLQPLDPVRGERGAHGDLLARHWC